MGLSLGAHRHPASWNEIQLWPPQMCCYGVPWFCDKGNFSLWLKKTSAPPFPSNFLQELEWGTLSIIRNDQQQSLFNPPIWQGNTLFTEHLLFSTSCSDPVRLSRHLTSSLAQCLITSLPLSLSEPLLQVGSPYICIYYIWLFSLANKVPCESVINPHGENDLQWTTQGPWSHSVGSCDLELILNSEKQCSGRFTVRPGQWQGSLLRARTDIHETHFPPGLSCLGMDLMLGPRCVRTGRQAGVGWHRPARRAQRAPRIALSA